MMGLFLGLAFLIASAQAEPESLPERVKLHGSLRVVTTDGEELLEPDGQLDLIAQWDLGPVEDPEGEYLAAKVEKGAWKIEVPRGSLVWFEDFYFGDNRPVGLMDSSGIVVEVDTELHLEAIQYQRPVLFVVDGETGEPVDKALVAHDLTIPFGSCYPTELDLEHDSIPSDGSRVRLPECDPKRSTWRWFSYYVGAKGKGWRWIVVDHRFGGEILVPLPEAGALQVRSSGRLPEGVAELRIDSLNNGRRVMYHRGALSAESIPVGTYAVRIVEAYIHPPKVLHEEVVEVETGKLTTVSIELPAILDRSGRVPLPVEASGRILFDEEFDPDSVRLRFLTTGLEGELARWSYGDPIQMERIPGSTNQVIWRHAGLILGRHRVSIEASKRMGESRPVRITWERDLEFDGTVATQLEVGQPRLLELTFADARTGAAIPSIPGIEGDFQYIQQWAWPSCRVLLQALEQHLALDVAQIGYLHKHVKIDLQPGVNRLELRMEPAAVLELSLFDQGRPVTLQREHWEEWEALVPQSVIRLEPVDQEAELLSWKGHYSSRAIRVGSNRSGSFLVHIDPPAGYMQPEPFVVDLEVGSTRKIDRELERLWK